jgi:uncharacterized phage-associated protein
MSGTSPEIANEFIELGLRNGKKFTQMQLQKLVYFAHGWNLAIMDAPLTQDDPSAFEFGPVYKTLWEALRHYGKRPVHRLIAQKEYFPGEFDDDLTDSDIARADLSGGERAIIGRVYADYSKFEAFQLSAITHEDDSPWSRVYNNGHGKYLAIRSDMIRDYFVELASRPKQEA